MYEDGLAAYQRAELAANRSAGEESTDGVDVCDHPVRVAMLALENHARLVKLGELLDADR